MAKKAKRTHKKSVSKGSQPAASGAVKISQLNDEQILSRLEAMGISTSKEAFRAEASGSATLGDIRKEWSAGLKKSAKADARFLEKAITELWHRFLPERPSVEMIDRWMQEGYEHAEQGDDARAADIWLITLRALESRFTETTRRTADADALFNGLESVEDWLLDFLELLEELAEHSPRYAEMGVEVCNALLVRFTQEEGSFLTDLRNARSSFAHAADTKA